MTWRVSRLAENSVMYAGRIVVKRPVIGDQAFGDPLYAGLMIIPATHH